jgi:hypothetical protein
VGAVGVRAQAAPRGRGWRNGARGKG